MAKYSEELKGVARALYLKRYTPQEIASELNLPNRRIVYYWAEKYCWAELLSHESTEDALNRRIQSLTLREGKSELELRELDSLVSHLVKLRAQHNKHQEKLAEIKHSENDAPARQSGGDEKPRKRGKYKKNDISGLTQEDFDRFALEHLFGYQKHLRANLHQQIRNILKSRQIGATWYFWEDHDENLPRPFGNREVWAGYDPARSGDTSTFVIIAPPIVAGEKFRVLRVFHWQGMNWKWQAAQIKKLFGQYNMTYIGIDITGLGSGVFEDVQHFAMRQAVAIRYGVETKNRLVMKMIDVIEDGRVEWDKEKTEIAASFMTIRRTSTASGNAMTFVADRTAETGHADSFWAIAHAIDNEPLNFENQRKSRWGNLGKAA